MAQVPATQSKTIVDLISSPEAKKQFKLALPKHLTPDRFVRVAITAMNKTPKLKDCTPASLIACLMSLSQLGLEPDGRKAHLIPYGNQCTLIVDYKGLVELARRSKEISNIHADIVCENDEFTFEHGNEEKLKHNPVIANRGKAVAAYSFVKFKDGSVSFEVMSLEEIEAIHKRSKAGAAGPWVTDWAEMAKKTVFRRHSKWLPCSSEILEATEKDFDTPIDISAGGIEGEENIKPSTQEPQAQNAAPIQEGAIIGIAAALALPAGVKFNVVGALDSFRSEKVGKDNKDITRYLICAQGEEGLDTMTISKWGTAHATVKANDNLVFRGVVGTIFKDKMQYLTDSIEILGAEKKEEKQA